jgi:NB-ARC domain
MTVDPRSISGAIKIDGKLVGTAWRAKPNVALTAAHCLRVDLLSHGFHQQCTIEFPDGSTGAAVRDLDQELDIAVLTLTSEGSSWIELAPLPWDDPRVIGEDKLRWHGYGYPDAKPDGLALTGAISGVSERAGEGIQLSCDQGGNGYLKHASGAAIIHGNRAVGVLRWHPEPLAGQVLYARPIDRICERFPFLSASVHPLQAPTLGERREFHSDRSQPRGGSSWLPASSSVFVGRNEELDAIGRAFAAQPSRSAARVTVQGMPGVGKTFLVDEFCSRNPRQFDTMCRWVMDPTRSESADFGLLELAQQAGVDRDRTPLDSIPAALAAKNLLVHIDNVDSFEAGQAAVELLAKLSTLPAIITGRYTSLGTSPTSNWVVVKVECLSIDQSLAMLHAELGKDAPAENDLRELATEVGGLPLALHLAAGYLRGGYSTSRFLGRLQSSKLGLKLVDPADPLWRTRSQGIVSLSFEISKEIFLSSAKEEGREWHAALAALGWATTTGFGPELGAAISGLTPDDFEEFIHRSTALSITRRVAKSDRPGQGWSVHPLLAEFVRADAIQGEVHERIGTWIKEFANKEPSETRANRWRVLLAERAQVHRWLSDAKAEELSSILPHAWPFAASVGPAKPWLESAQRALQVRPDGSLEWVVANLAWRSGDLELAWQASLRVPVNSETDIHVGLLQGEVLKAKGDRPAAAMLANEKLIPSILEMPPGVDRAILLGGCAELIAEKSATRAIALLEKEVLPYLRIDDDKRKVAVARATLASAYYYAGDFKRSIAIREKEVLPVHRAENDVREIAANIENVAAAHVAVSDAPQACEALSKALPLFVELGDRAAVWRVVSQLLFLKLSLGSYSEAKQIALSYLIAWYEEKDPVQGAVCAGIEIAEKICSLPDAASSGEIETALEFFLDSRVSGNAHRILSQLALNLENDRKANLALKVAKFAADRFVGQTDIHTSTAKARVADLLLATGDFVAAERCYVDVLPVLEAAGAGMALALAVVRLASVRCFLQRYDDAFATLRGDCLSAWSLLDAEQRKQISPIMSLMIRHIAEHFIMREMFDYAKRVIRQYLIPIAQDGGPMGSEYLAAAKKQLKEIKQR